MAQIVTPLDMKVNGQARHRWLTPMILATWKAEIRRLEFGSQPWAYSHLDPILKKAITKKS
jgi:hypothetical protein